jgi:uncharacterized membrane protein (DUF2068 family)
MVEQHSRSGAWVGPPHSQSGYTGAVRSGELWACGWHGHVTYAPTEPDLAERLRAQTALGESWRCLRCGDWALGPPAASGPADQAPVPARGKALRQLVILRLLAVERLVRALVLIIAAYGVYRFESAQTALRNLVESLIPAARPLADRLGVDLDHSVLVGAVYKALHEQRSMLNLVVAGLLAYGVLELVEGIGLWLAKRWAEYLTVIATSVFLPYEIYELTRSVTATKVVAFLINVAAVVYLVLAKRLFGVRGGRAAYEREVASESLLEVTAAGRQDDLSGTAGRDVGI